MGADARAVNQIGRDILLGMVGAIPTVLIVVILGGFWVARKAVRPVDAIRQAAAGISLQNLDKRFPVPAVDDEIAGLIDVLNAMLNRLQASFEQSVRFSAEASHQLKTPLAVLRADVEAMLHAGESLPGGAAGAGDAATDSSTQFDCGKPPPAGAG